MFSRRFFLQFTGLGYLATLIGCSNNELEKTPQVIDTSILFKRPISGLYSIKLENKLPNDLKGTLYSNGASIFERNGIKKKHILDGDGFLIKLVLDGDSTTFSGKFIKTDIFKEEEDANDFLNDTSSFKDGTKSKGILSKKNYSNHSSSSIKFINNKLFSFGSNDSPYQIDTDDLNSSKFYKELTEEQISKKSENLENIKYHSSHGKIDLETEEFINFGIEYGNNKLFDDIKTKQKSINSEIYKSDSQEDKKSRIENLKQELSQLRIESLYCKIHVKIVDKNSNVIFTKTINLHDIFKNQETGGISIYDFFVTKSFIILNIQPLFIDLSSVKNEEDLGSSEKSFLESHSWDSTYKNQILVINRASSSNDILKIESKFSRAYWHTINAYEIKSNDEAEIILDYISYDKFNFFNTKENAMAQAINGHINFRETDRLEGLPTRDIIRLSELNSQTGFYNNISFISSNIRSQQYNCEYPTINNNFIMKKNNFFYSVLSDQNAMYNGIGKFNNKTVKWDKFSYSNQYICGEPIFCEKDISDQEDDGYIISIISNLQDQETFIGIFDAKNISKGAISRIKLDSSLPFRSHGLFIKES